MKRHGLSRSGSVCRPRETRDLDPAQPAASALGLGDEQASVRAGRGQQRRCLAGVGLPGDGLRRELPAPVEVAGVQGELDSRAGR